ncbi:GTP-binding protein [uncultured Psychromonas sp.]|uniref:GTP-binding protein n=1 Tax=uncultured Psychromonas sp. TaxID=173974 RepID=UPI003450454F
MAFKTVLSGCLCCLTGLPFPVTLNGMITNNKPDLIFVEPVRTGHLNEATLTMH